MTEPDIKTNSPRAWLLAARPKTLTAAAVPVMIGAALAVPHRAADFALPATLCLLFAFIMQVAANFVNDYFDFRRGADGPDRLGPKRACAEGWVSPRAMRRAIVLTLAVACAVGLPLVYWGGVAMIAVGAACVAFCVLYTTVFSRIALGDVLVLLFFGLVPVCCTCWLLTGAVSAEAVASAVACGLVVDALLIVNNYRDLNGDRAAGKRTLIVLTGRRGGLALYLACGLAACLLGLVHVAAGRPWAAILPLAYLALHIRAWRTMGRRTGRALNATLGETARNIFIYGLLTTAGLLC